MRGQVRTAQRWVVAHNYDQKVREAATLERQRVRPQQVDDKDWSAGDAAAPSIRRLYTSLTQTYRLRSSCSPWNTGRRQSVLYLVRLVQCITDGIHWRCTLFRPRIWTRNKEITGRHFVSYVTYLDLDPVRRGTLGDNSKSFNWYDWYNDITDVYTVLTADLNEKSGNNGPSIRQLYLNLDLDPPVPCGTLGDESESFKWYDWLNYSTEVYTVLTADLNKK